MLEGKTNKQILRGFLAAEMLAFYAALLAVILSQLPPLYEIFEKAKAEISMDGWVTISHGLGQPRAMLPITISNDGSATLIVDSINCELINIATKKTWKMKAVTYVDQSSVQPFVQTREIPLGRLRRVPNSQWSETIHCVTQPSPAQVEAYQSIFMEMTDYLNSLPRLSPDSPAVVFPDEIWTKAREQFEVNFGLTPGDYVIKLSIFGDLNEEASHTSNKFQVSRGDITKLKRHVNSYKFGGGIIVPGNGSYDVSKVIN